MSRQPPPDIVAAAQAAAMRWRIRASVQLAQWALESAWGERVTGTFNYFGVKAAGDQPSTLCWTHEVVDGNNVRCQQPFRNYASPADAFDEHARLLATSPYYAAARATKTPDAFVDAMAVHYATDPGYATSLKALLRGNNFLQYDSPQEA